MESCLLIWNYDPTAEEERRTRCLTIRRPIIPFRAKRRGSGCAIWPPTRRRSTRSRRVIVPRKWALILHDLAEFLGYFWLFGIWFWPSVGVAPAKSIALPSIALFLLCMRGAAPLAYAAIPWVLDIPDEPDAQFYAWATQKSVAYLRFFLRMLPVIAIFILP